VSPMLAPNMPSVSRQILACASSSGQFAALAVNVRVAEPHDPDRAGDVHADVEPLARAVRQMLPPELALHQVDKFIRREFLGGERREVERGTVRLGNGSARCALVARRQVFQQPLFYGQFGVTTDGGFVELQPATGCAPVPAALLQYLDGAPERGFRQRGRRHVGSPYLIGQGQPRPRIANGMVSRRPGCRVSPAGGQRRLGCNARLI
jgi:hypothetical protein